MKLTTLSIIILDLFLCLLVIFMVQAAPPPKSVANHDDPAFVKIELRWDNAVDADVDLWAIAPGESQAVGYTNKQGLELSLQRDDLGHSATKDSQNYELIDAYGYYAGEWVVNAHLYRYRSGPMPVNVHLVVSRRHPGGNWEVIVDVKAPIVAQGDELTVARFQMDAKGDVVPGSVNNLPMALRAP